MEATASKDIEPELRNRFIDQLDEIMADADKVAGLAEAADMICAADSLDEAEERVFSLYGSLLREIGHRQSEAAKACFALMKGEEERIARLSFEWEEITPKPANCE